jgi:hypothetical protein
MKHSRITLYLSNRHFIVKGNTELTDLTPVNAGVPKAASSAPYYTSYTQPTFLLHRTPSQLLLPTTLRSSDPATASQKLQASLLEIQSWLNTRRMKATETRSVHVTFTTGHETCPPVHINDVQIPQENHVKYLGLHLD